ncbi:hypothetical protein ACFQ1E_03930 [Sphingomonas canadensis]|uniref:Lipoprotein n=1 Tax=Sphingomonas canadensis TaxID=1219257 RepID=A0ABW3H5P8_9SPHN|nr:hypothetical protein [Sphingomonas canadensis]MCW3834607.1 hypothetical protein [Sphingomonas canadensis]
MRSFGMVALLALAGCTQGAPAANNAAEANLTANLAEPAPVANSANAAEPVVNAAEAAPANASTAAKPAEPLSDVDLEHYPELRGVPAEVQQWVIRRQGCEHWAGEPDFDAQRRKQIEDAVAELCPGIDKTLAALNKKYAGDAKVMKVLKEYEPLGMDD